MHFMQYKCIRNESLMHLAPEHLQLMNNCAYSMLCISNAFLIDEAFKCIVTAFGPKAFQGNA